MNITLRPYQVEAIEKVRAAIRLGKRRILVVAPTGAGKTVIGAQILHGVEAKMKTGVFVAHRREIIRQTGEKLETFGIEHAYFMAGEKMSALQRIQVASIQTFHSRVTNGKRRAPDAHVIIYDEAHRSISRMYKEMLEKYPSAILIGLTATPCRSDGRGLGDLYEDMVEVTTVQALVDEGYLVPTRIFAPTMPDLKGVKVQAGDYVASQLEQKLNKPKLVGDVIRDWKLRASNRPTVVFASGVAHSKALAQEFQQNGVRTAHIDGTTDKELRDNILTRLSGGDLDVVCNCMVLTEGWDCPPVSCAVLVRPTKSYGLYLQMAGRILRPADGKTDAMIIDHSGACYQHGFPEHAGGWTLDPDKKIADIRKEKQASEPQPTTCMECHTVYTGLASCPTCGWVPTKKAKKVMLAEGRLREVPKVKKERKIETQEDRQKLWNECIYKASYKGLKAGAAAHMYRKQTGVWPRNLERMPYGSQWQMLARDFLAR